MARVALCDRCGAIIKTSVIKHVGFSSHDNNLMTVYEVCDKCYDELEKSMKINMDNDGFIPNF